MQRQIEQLNFFSVIDASVRDYYDRRAAELLPKIPCENLICEPVVRYTENGQPMYPTDDPSEIYRHNDWSLLSGTLFKDQKIIDKTVYVSNGLDGKNYRAGFLDGEIVVKRLVDSKGRWPQKRNMKPYILLTPAKYHFAKTSDIVEREFKPGSTLWIPCGGELRVNGDRKKEKIDQIRRGY